ARGLPFPLAARLVGFLSVGSPFLRRTTGPLKADHHAMKATPSRAAGSNQTGALRGLSCVAERSAWSNSCLAAVTLACAVVSAARVALQDGPHCFKPRALLALACALTNEASAPVSAAWARATAPRLASRSAWAPAFA